jgi:thiamine-phosphate pyrophosphorylase
MNSFAALAGHGLYVITDGPRPDLLDVVAQALDGGARLLQYRDKTNDGARRHKEATALKTLCREHGVPLIINADIGLAKAIGADGVHIGPEEADLATARRLMGSQAIIGVSCMASLLHAEAAARGGANYVSFGAFHPSRTKPLAGRAPIELLGQSAALGIPRVAIGGITPDNGGLLVAAGADFLAAISAVFRADDVRATARRFSDLYLPEHGTSA